MRDILEACLKGANKTKIVYRTNLNFCRSEKYLGLLLNLGFVVAENEPETSVVYRTTGAGLDFLSGCLRMQKSLENVPAGRRAQAPALAVLGCFSAVLCYGFAQAFLGDFLSCFSAVFC
jgi:predicted transcriptional regulator